jgi:Flp pilus assembly protein TadD
MPVSGLARCEISAVSADASVLSSQTQTWLLAFLLVLGVILAYQPVWHAGFIWDDDAYVTQNKLLTAPDGLQRIWFSKDSPSQYFPLVYTTFRLERLLWGLNPAGYHWVNLLLHAANGLLVWRVLRRLAVPGAWLAAALFAFHPVQVESVAWITERKNVMSLFFMLLAMLAWLEFIEERPGRTRYYALALICHALALFSKTTACTLPAALVLVLWLKHKPITGRRVAQVAPFAALGLVMGLVTVWWERYHVGTHGPTFEIGLLERLLIATRGVWFYAEKLLWPANLTFSYPRWVIVPTDPAAYLWLVLGLGLAFVIYRARRLLGRGPEVAAVYYVAMLSPLLGFIMLYTFAYSFVADHYQYAASIGPLALAAAGITVGLQPCGPIGALVRPVLCGGLVLVLSALTWHQALIYKDLETLWRDTIAKNPGSWMAHESLGVLLLHPGGHLEEAATEFNKTLELKPEEARAHDSLGIVLSRQGRTDEAMKHFREAIRLQPRDPKAYNNLAMALQSQRRLDEAISQLENALTLVPDDPELHNTLGMAFGRKGRIDDAIVQLKQAIRLDPDNAQAHNNLGLAFSRKGRAAEAVTEYETALRLNPSSAETHASLGVVLAQQGRRDEAINQLTEALRLRPNYLQAEQQLRALKSQPPIPPDTAKP